MTGRLARGLLVSLSALSMLSGCAALDVRYPETAASPAMLASVAPQRVVVGAVADRRVDKARIGTTPDDGDAIVTRRPVTDIVREALMIELTKNGHTVVSEGGDVVLTAQVEEFWVDAVGTSSATLYLGRVAIALVVAEAHRHVAADAEIRWRQATRGGGRLESPSPRSHGRRAGADPPRPRDRSRPRRSARASTDRPRCRLIPDRAIRPHRRAGRAPVAAAPPPRRPALCCVPAAR